MSIHTSFAASAPTALEAVRITNEIGVPCYFGRKGLARHHLVEGWSAAEETHHWNDGFEASFTLSLDMVPTNRLQLRVEGCPYLSPAVPRQDMTMYFNGARLGFWRIEVQDNIVLEAFIEPEHWFNRMGTAFGTCMFHLPDSRRPRDIGAAEDDRRLGFCFQNFILATPVPKLRG